MMNDIIVSIIIPCFNDGQYILETLESINRQSLKNWEVIIVNDGSTDAYTCDILKSLPNERIQVLHTPQRGPSAARNLGISKACGRYILPLDADDKIAETYIEKASKVLDNRADVEIVYCLAEYFGMLRGRWNLRPYDPESFVLVNMIFAAAMYRRSTWERAGGYSENMIYGMEDYDFWLKILSRGGTVYRIEEVLFYYRVKPHSRTASLKRNKREMERLAYETLFENNIEFYCRPENARIVFSALRKSWVSANEIRSSILWCYCFRYIVKLEVEVQIWLKRLIGRA